MKRCSKCVLPETTPNIVFGQDGVCNYCRSYQKLKYRGEGELLRLLDSYRRAGSKYDCIVTISGGRDSTYTLLKLVRDYGMKVLAVNYENPFTDAQAKANIDNAVKVLNLDIVRFKLKNRLHERIFRNNATAWFGKPSPGLVPMMCIACKNLWWHILKIAEKRDIHLVVSGGNRFEEVSFKKVLLGTPAGERAETTLVKEIFGVLREALKNHRYFKPQLVPAMVKGYLFGNPYALGSRLLGHTVLGIDLFFFIPWNEQEVVSRIRSELNWDYPGEANSSWRFDCRIGHLKDFMYMEILGMTERDDFYAKMVRENLMTREEALLRLQKENRLHLAHIQPLLREVGIDCTAVLEKQRM